jgi:hypothetical protein
MFLVCLVCFNLYGMQLYLLTPFFLMQAWAIGLSRRRSHFTTGSYLSPMSSEMNPIWAFG